MSSHPYRDPAPSVARPERAAAALGTEELVLYGVIVLVGAAGVAIGATASRSSELTLGGLMVLFGLRSLVAGLRARLVAGNERARARARLGRVRCP